MVSTLMPAYRNETEVDNQTTSSETLILTNFPEDLGTYKPYGERLETYLVPIIFGFVFIVGLIGNGVLMLVFFRHKSMRTIPNMYIFSLSMGDLLVITGALPFVSTIYTFESWPYGEFVCKLSEFIRDTSVSVTVITLTALSVDRYIAIVLPLRRFVQHRKRQVSLWIVTAIWVFSILFAAPGAHFSFILKINVSESKSVDICYPFPEKLGPLYPKIIVMTKFLVLYVIPLASISLFYLLIAVHLYRTSHIFSQSNESHKRQVRCRVKVTKLVLVLIVMFAVCLFPNHVFMLWFYFHPSAQESYNGFWHYWRIVGFTLSFLNSCLNPIALYCVSGAFRKLFQRYLFCIKINKLSMDSNAFGDGNDEEVPSSKSFSSTRHNDEALQDSTSV